MSRLKKTAGVALIVFLFLLVAGVILFSVLRESDAENVPGETEPEETIAPTETDARTGETTAGTETKTNKQTETDLPTETESEFFDPNVDEEGWIS